MKKISCIIPTYNEETRIENVLKAVYDHPLITEIIVVDDGSKDNTLEIIKKFKNIHLVVHSKNQGKSSAVCTGVKESTGEFLFLLDADLIGLTPKDITNLIEPVTSGLADISISLRKNAPLVWRVIGLDFISGERVIPRNIMADNLEKIKILPRFGLESFMNTIIIKNNYRIKIVHWMNTESPYKSRKHGFWAGIKGELKMYLDIFKTIGIFGPVYQIVKILRLMIK